MLIDSFDTERKVLVVAEIGNNHEGSVAVAEEMVRRAAAAGADAVKFQTFKTEQYISPHEVARFARLKRFELTYDQFARLAELARNEGVLFISTPFDLDSAAFLKDMVAAIKISSGDNTFLPLLEAVARTGKPILLSCGIATIEQLRYAQAVIQQVWRASGIEQKLNDRARSCDIDEPRASARAALQSRTCRHIAHGHLAVLHCVSGYPVPPEQANLAAIRTLQHELACTVGYSDHTMGIDAAALSVAVGARIVEKHFTIDKNHSAFRDHQLSADPAEMADLVKRIRKIETLLGSGDKVLQPSEEGAVTALRRSIAAKRDLRAGTCLRWDDITWVRPGGGTAPGREAALLGRTLKRSVKSGEPISPDMFEDGYLP